MTHKLADRVRKEYDEITHTRRELWECVNCGQIAPLAVLVETECPNA